MTDNTNEPNPREVIGGNFPPIIDTLREQLPILGDMLAQQFKPIADAATASLAAARDLPETVADKEDVAKYATAAKSIKEVKTLLEPERKKAKQPFLDGGKKVDGFFTGIDERLDKALAIMGKRVKAWQDTEDARIKREAEEAARVAREAERKRLEEIAAIEEKARQQRIADERERANERQAARDAAAGPAPAPAPEPAPAPAMTLAELREQSAVAMDHANLHGHDARVADKAANAKPADNVRVRGSDGAMATSQQFWTHEVLDLAAIPPALLWPFISDRAKEVAIGAFVKAGNRDLPGVRIFQDTKTNWL